MQRIQYQKVCLFSMFLTLFLVTALRPETVGTDTWAYLSDYEHAYFNHYREPGYNYFVDFLRLFSDDSLMLLFATGLLVSSCFFWSVNRFSYVPTYSLTFFAFMYFPVSLNIIRQFLAISLFYSFSLFFISKKDFYKYILTILVLTTFHYSSILLIPMFLLHFIVEKKINIKIILIAW